MTDDTFADGGSNRAPEETGDDGSEELSTGTDGAGAISTGDDAGGSFGTSRRTFMKTAGASAGALAFGTSVASADEHDGGLPQLYVEGNRIVDGDGNEPPLRGVTIEDPKALDVTAPARGKDAGQLMDLLTDGERGWHPTVVRIPIRPVNVGEHEPVEVAGAPAPVAFDEQQLQDYLDAHLDPVIDRLADAGVYAVVDFQRTDDSDAPDWTAPELSEEVELFWETVAPRYADRNHVLYEVNGLPTEPGMWGDPTEQQWVADPWYDWKETAQPWVDLIREHAPETIVIVGTPGYNTSPEGVLLEPFDGANLAYAYHNFPGFDASENQAWDRAGENGYGTMGVAEDVPLFVTEFGWRNDDGSAYPEDTDGTFEGPTGDYGEPFLEWMESQPGLYWTAAHADPVHDLAAFSMPFTDLEPEAIRELDPYAESVPEECSERPCEWALLGEGAGDYDDYMGAAVKERLAELQADVEFSPADRSRPVPPTTLDVVSRATDSITVTWQSIEEAEQYGLYLKGEQVRDVSGIEATLSDLEPGTHRVGVTSVDADGVASVRSSHTVATEPVADHVPSPPQDLQVSPTADGELVVSWQPVDIAKSYEVAVDGEVLAEPETSEAVLSAVDTDSELTIVVTAVNTQGRSDPRETTFVPVADREHALDLSIWAGDITPGADWRADLRLGSVTPELTGIEFTLQVGDEAGSADVARVIDVEPADEFGAASIGDIGDDGTTSVPVSLEDGSLPDRDFGFDLGVFTFSTHDVGETTVSVTDVAAHYEHLDEPIAVDSVRETLVVDGDQELRAPRSLNVSAAPDGGIDASWASVEHADGYEVYVADELAAEVEEPSVTLSGVDQTEETTVGVVAVNEVVESSISEETYVPPVESSYDLQIDDYLSTVDVGERFLADVELVHYATEITGIDFTIEIESTEDVTAGGSARIVEVTPTSTFDEIDVGDVGEDTTSVDVSLHGAPSNEGSATRFLSYVRYEGTGVGEVQLQLRDVELSFAHRDEPVSIEGTSVPLEIRSEDPPSAPALLDVEERTASTVELSWPAVPDASEYAVYATEYEVSNAEVEEVSPLTPPGEDALVERTGATSATVDGLDPLESYEVGVTAVSEQLEASPVTGRPVTTAVEQADQPVPTIAAELEEDLIEEGQSTTASLVLSDPPEELLGYAVEVRVEDPSIATVEAVSYDPAFGLTQVRARDDGGGEWVTLEGISSESIDSGGDDVPLGSVELDAVDPGTTNVVVTAEPLSVESRVPVEPATQSASISVDVENWEGTMQRDGVVYEPNDANGDGLYRDVTGDDTVSNGDIMVFFRNQHTDVVQNHAELFDFTGSGEVGQADVVELFHYVN